MLGFADPRLVPAALVDERSLADHGIHHGEVGRQDDPYAHGGAVRAECGRIPLLHGTEETEFSTGVAVVVVKGHGR